MSGPKPLSGDAARPKKHRRTGSCGENFQLEKGNGWTYGRGAAACVNLPLVAVTNPSPHSEFATVVSGVPRSGTSLMMQMLAAGGIELLTDSERAPDAGNPRGYFEFAPVKRLRNEARWFPEALGYAVKVVYALLKSLPDDVAARVVFMQRDLAEVVASQRAMLSRSGNPTDVLPPERMIEIFRAQVDETLEWVSQQPRLQLLEVAHAEAIREPASVACAVNAFLGGGLDVSAMAAVPDPALYHQRTARR